MRAPSTLTTASNTAVKCQLIVPRSRMLAITAMPGGIVFQVSELSMSHAALAAAVMRPASAPGNWSTK
jgi:hypothetical protein